MTAIADRATPVAMRDQSFSSSRPFGERIDPPAAPPSVLTHTQVAQGARI
ncbi:hypothetical protein [Sphingomonas sp.]